MKRYLKTSIAGYTLLELMVTVGIIAFLAAMAVPAWWKMQPNLRLKTATRDTANMLQQARMYSVANNKYSELQADYDNDTVYWRALPDGVWTRIDSWKDVDLYKESGSPLGTGSQLADNPSGDVIRFRPDGTSTVSGTNSQEALYMKNKKNPGNKFRVRVTASGSIKIEKLTVDQWG